MTQKISRMKDVVLGKIHYLFVLAVGKRMYQRHRTTVLIHIVTSEG